MINVSIAQVHDEEEFVQSEIKKRKWKQLNPSDQNVNKTNSPKLIASFVSIDPDEHSYIKIFFTEGEYDFILERGDFEPISLQYSSIKEIKAFLLKSQVGFEVATL
jgi:hypothetical protein